jgi:Tol biopolymer transport system component
MNDTKDLLERVGDRFTFPDDMFERLRRRRDRKRRNQRIAAGVVGITVFIAAIWIVTSVGSVDRTQTPAVSGRPETGPTPTRVPYLQVPYLIDLNTGELTPLPTSIAGVGGYSVSPDGTMVAYVSDDDEGRRNVFIASLDGTDVQQVTHHDVRGPALTDFPDWSPDGAAIAYSRGESGLGDGRFRNVFVLDLATGVTSQVTNEKPQGVGMGALHPQFSPDGASIVYWVLRGDDFGVRSVPVTGGKSTLLVGGGKNDVQASFPTFSPDGSALAVGCFGRLDGICIAGADGTNLRELVSVPPVYHLYGPEWSPDGTRIAYTTRATNWTAYTTGATNNDRVFVVDVATGETTFVAEGIADDWLDDHTLIVMGA